MSTHAIGDAFRAIIRMFPAVCVCSTAWAGSPCSASSAEAAKDHEAPAEPIEAPSDTITWSPRQLSLHVGAHGHLAVDLLLPQGFEVFRDDVHVSVVDAKGLWIGEPELPPGHLVQAPEGEPHAMAYVRDVRILLPVSAVDVAPGLRKLVLSAEVRGCSAKRCHAGAAEELAVFVHVVARDEMVAGE